MRPRSLTSRQKEKRGRGRYGDALNLFPSGRGNKTAKGRKGKKGGKKENGGKRAIIPCSPLVAAKEKKKKTRRGEKGRMEEKGSQSLARAPT